MTIFTGANAPTVGLTETNALSDALRALGMRVIVGADLNESARLIKDAISQGSEFPIISLEDKVGIGKKSFLSRYAKTGHKVVIISNAPGSIIESPESTYVKTPARIGDILVAAGFAVDANDPRLASRIDDSYSLTPSGGAPAAAAPAARPAAADPFADVPAPAVRPAAPVAAQPAAPAAPALTQPSTRREARVVPASPAAVDPNDPFADVPEAKVGLDGEVVAQVFADTPAARIDDAYVAPSAPIAEPVAAPAPVEDSFDDVEPDWMKPASTIPVAPAPVAAPVEEEPEPDWMNPTPVEVAPAAPVASPVTDDDDTPEWAQPKPASTHQNQSDTSWLSSVTPDDDEYVPNGRHSGAPVDDDIDEDEVIAEEPAVALPVFDDAPLDPSFDPNWEPPADDDDEPVVDLNEPASFIPAPTSPVIARPRATPEPPSWMDTSAETEAAAAAATQPDEPIWMQEALQEASTPVMPVVEPEPTPEPALDFEIVAPVFAPDPTIPVVEEIEEPQKSFDDLLDEMMSSAEPTPVTPAPAVVQERPQAPVVQPGAIPAFDPSNSAMWAQAPAQPTTPAAEAPATFRPAAPTNVPLCPIIVSMASKGGVGKTTIATALAERAARAGLKVTLIDGNRGQGGIRKFLRVNERVVSIYDAAVRNDPKAAIAYPKEIAAARDPKLPQIGFAVVLAPPDALADPRVVTAQMYAEVVRYARSVSDLVILDTQISERFDTTGIIESVAIPAIGSDNGFGLGITDGSSEGVRNLAERLEHFSSIGIGREHLFSIVNKINYFDESIVASFRSRYDPYSTFIGVVGADDDFQNKHNVGIIDVDGSSLAPALTAILRNSTRDARFAPPSQEPPKRGGLFGKNR